MLQLVGVGAWGMVCPLEILQSPSICLQEHVSPEAFGTGNRNTCTTPVYATVPIIYAWNGNDGQMTPALDFLTSRFVSEGIRTGTWMLLRAQYPRTHHKCDRSNCSKYRAGINASVYHTRPIGHLLKCERLIPCSNAQKEACRKIGRHSNRTKCAHTAAVRDMRS